jgi:hypothetical protein
MEVTNFYNYGTMNQVEPGATQINHYYGSGKPDEEPTEEPVEMPAELAESDLWKKVQEAGLVDAEGQPTVSRTEAALMANELAERLDIAHKWKLFEALWHRKNMRGDYNTALEQRKSLLFQEELKKLFR